MHFYKEVYSGDPVTTAPTITDLGTSPDGLPGDASVSGDADSSAQQPLVETVTSAASTAYLGIASQPSSVVAGRAIYGAS